MQIDIEVRDSSLKTQDITVYGGQALTISFSAVNPSIGDAAVLTFAASDQDEPEETLSEADGVFEIGADALDGIVSEGENIRYWLWTGAGADINPRVNGTIHHRYAIGPTIVGAWLLSTGSWDDSGIWNDNETWTEAA